MTKSASKIIYGGGGTTQEAPEAKGEGKAVRVPYSNGARKADGFYSPSLLTEAQAADQHKRRSMDDRHAGER